MQDPTYEEQKAEIAKQDEADRLARSQDPGAMGNIEVAGRNRGESPENIFGTWQNQQREIQRFNDAQAEERRRDPAAMGRTDAAELADRRQQQQPSSPIPPAQQQTQPLNTPQFNVTPRMLSVAASTVGAFGGPSAISVLQLPIRGFTLAERAWLLKLIFTIQTNKGIAGRNVSIDNRNGQVINARDCELCT